MHVNKHFQGSEEVVVDLLAQIDEKTWQRLAMQRLDLFPRIKVSEESCKIFTDFTIHTKAPKTTKKDNLDEDCESKNIAKDNYIVEAVKSSIKKLDRANTNRSDAKSISHRYHRNIICSPLIASTAQQSSDNLQTSNSASMKQLNDCKIYFDEENDNLRSKQKERMQYEQQLEQQRILANEEKERMSNLRRKRFKELTTYTYDYEGTLVKSVDKIQDINVIKINSKLNAKMQIKKNKFKNQQANNVLTVKLNKLDRFHHSSGDHGGLIKPFQKLSNVLDLFRSEQELAKGVKVTELDSNKSLGKGIDNKNFFSNRLKSFHKYSKSFQSSTNALSKSSSAIKQVESPLVDEVKKYHSQQQTQRPSQIHLRLRKIISNRQSIGSISVNNSKEYTEHFMPEDTQQCV